MKISRFRIPKKIALPGVVISVRELPEKEMTADASWEYDAAAIIFIRKDLPIRRKRYLLLHELQHVLVDLMYVSLDDHPDIVATQ